MRRLAFPIAAVIALSCLNVIAARSDSARAYDLPAQPTTLDCFSGNPFGRSVPLAKRLAFSLTERKFNGELDTVRGVVNPQGNALTAIGPSSRYASVAALGAETSAQLTGTGAESIVRLKGAAGSAPKMSISRYPSGTGGAEQEVSASGASLPAADAVAMTADNFQDTTDSEWLSGGLVTEPDEVAVAWRSPYSATSNETINVGLFKPTSGGTNVAPYGAVYVLPGNFYPSKGTAQDVLAISSGDLDLDGDPEIILAYQWGAGEDIHVDVLNLTNPANPTLSLVAQTSFSVNIYAQNTRPGVSQITVATGSFGSSTTGIVVGWQVTDPSWDAASAELRTLVLPHNTGSKPPPLTTPNPPWFTVPLISLGSRSFITQTGDSWKTSTFAVAVGDIDAKAAPVGMTAIQAGTDEVEVAFADAETVRVLVLDPDSPGLTTELSTVDSAISASSPPRGVTLGAGDMDLDADADILLVYSNSSAVHRAVWFAASDDRLSLVSRAAFTPDLGGSGLGNTLPIVMSDLGNQSVRMVQRRPASGPACVDVKTPIVLSAADPAPFWRTDGHWKWNGYTVVGAAQNTTSSAATSVTQTRSTSMTLTAGFDSEFLDVWEVEANIEFESAWETSTSTTTGTTSDISSYHGLSNYSGNSDVEYALGTYRCFYYDLTRPGGLAPAQVRACMPVTTDTLATGLANTDDWESGIVTSSDEPPLTPDDYSWAPYRSEFTNLALTLPASAATDSVSSGTAGRAIDSLKDAQSSSTVAATSVSPNPWWQVKLDKSDAVGLVRVYPAALSICGNNGLIDNEPGVCEDVLRDFDVYIFDDDSLANASAGQLEAAAQQSGSGVTRYHFAGTPAKVANIVTRTPAATGKYVRVQAKSSAAALQLAEVQVYPASDRPYPPDYPCAVRELTTAEKSSVADKNVFVASMWNQASKTCVDKYISGQLVPMEPSPDWMIVTAGECDSYPDHNWSSSSSTDTAFDETTSKTQGVGGSIDVSYGPDVLTEKLGYSYASNWGTEQTSSTSTSIGKSFTVGWARANFCKRDPDGNQVSGYHTAAACTYQMKPFYFMEEEWANSGYQQLFPHVSYVVSMNRAKDLTDCYDDHWRKDPNVAPTASALTVSTQGSAVVIDPLRSASDQNPEDVGRLAIRGVTNASSGTPGASTTTTGGGTAEVIDDKVKYTPTACAAATDSFYVTITDHDLESAPIKVTINNTSLINGGFTCAPILAGWTASTGGLVITGVVGGGQDTNGSPCNGCFARMMVPAAGGTATLKQSFTVPSSGSGTLVVFRRGNTSEPVTSPARDTLQLSVTSGGITQVLRTISNKDATGSWTANSYDLSAYKGKVIELKFTASGPNDGYTTYFSVDSISIS